MSEDLYCIITHKIVYCLFAANPTKLGLMLFFYLKTKLFQTEKAARYWLKYNEDQICRDCYGKSDLSAKRGRENLEEKNILIFDKDERQVKLNCDPSTWRVTPEQHERIMNIINDDNLVYKRVSE